MTFVKGGNSRAGSRQLGVEVTPLVAFTGTAVRFSGQSFGRYRLPEFQNGHIHFRLKTLQSQAILLFSNKTVRLSLKVRNCHPERFPGGMPGWEVGQYGRGQEGKLLQRNPAWFTMSLGVTLEGQNTRLSSYNGQNPPHLGMHHVLVQQRLGCSVG